MKRVVRLTTVAGLAAGLVLSMMAGPSGAASASVDTAAASVATASTTSVVSASAASTPRFNPRARFAREFIRRGDSDTSVYDIDHVRELQYRLRWAGVYGGPVTGYFGDQTFSAVKRFQRRSNLRVTGTANLETWAKLIRKTIRERGDIPARCKVRRVKWHACYDRANHQVTLWRHDQLWNSWLVRGGSYDNQTRLGNNYVFSRDKDHVSGIFGSPMPYSQFFDGGQALHGSSTMIDPFDGHSHGCINMYNEDARQLWKLTTRTPMSQMKVTVYGEWS